MRLLIFVFMMLHLASCKSQKSNMEVQQTEVTGKKQVAERAPKSNDIENSDTITYIESTRGYFFSVVQSGELIYVTKIRDGEAERAAISAEDVKQLNALVVDLDLKGISRLEAPSQLRTYDAAPFAFIKVIKSGTEYKSSSFDAGNPPKELKALVGKIKTLSELVK